MKFLFIFIFLTLSIGDTFAEEEKKTDAVTVDAYLLKAGWEKQNEGWMDPETGLVWGPLADKTSWGEAKSYCQGLNIGGKTDWRLPTVEEMQRSVCKVYGYGTRNPCPQPRDHQKDLWLLNNEKGTTYWAGNIIPGDPYNAYYFVFDVEGQQVITSKGDKSKLRCVTAGVTPKAIALVAATEKDKIGKTEEVQNTPPKPHTFYIAPLIGFGGFLSNEVSLDNYFYLNGEFRFGYKIDKDMMLQATVDTGLKASPFDYPVITTIAVGPEYFILPERLSVFVDLGVGILSINKSLTTPGVITMRQTNAGFAWRAGSTLAVIKWGDSGQYNIPISLVYTGYKTSMIFCNTVMLSAGLMYFN